MPVIEPSRHARHLKKLKSALGSGNSGKLFTGEEPARWRRIINIKICFVSNCVLWHKKSLLPLCATRLSRAPVHPASTLKWIQGGEVTLKVHCCKFKASMFINKFKIEIIPQFTFNRVNSHSCIYPISTSTVSSSRLRIYFLCVSPPLPACHEALFSALLSPISPSAPVEYKKRKQRNPPLNVISRKTTQQ